MSQYRTHTKGYQNQIHEDRNHIDHIIRNRYMGPEHHHDHDSKRNHHLKQILKQQNNDQKYLEYILSLLLPGSPPRSVRFRILFY